MKVTKRSCDVTPRSKYQKSKGRPWSPCASNLVQFRLLFTTLRHFEKNGTRHFSLIGRHLESVSRTIPVFKHTLYRRGSRIFCRGGGSTTAVYCGRLWRPRRRGGLGLINIRLRYIASIEYSERFFFDFFFLLVKMVVESKRERKLVVESRGGGSRPPTPPPPPPWIRACYSPVDKPPKMGEALMGVLLRCFC